jgi:preprotein translocase subunit SecE
MNRQKLIKYLCMFAILLAVFSFIFFILNNIS